MIECNICEKEFDREDGSIVRVDDGEYLPQQKAFVCWECQEQARELEAAHRRGVSHEVYCFGDRPH